MLARRDVTAVKDTTEKENLIKTNNVALRAHHFFYLFILSGTIQITAALSLERVEGTTVQRTSGKEGKKCRRASDSLLTTTPTKA